MIDDNVLHLRKGGKVKKRKGGSTQSQNNKQSVYIHIGNKGRNSNKQAKPDNRPTYTNPPLPVFTHRTETINHILPNRVNNNEAIEPIRLNNAEVNRHIQIDNRVRQNNIRILALFNLAY